MADEEKKYFKKLTFSNGTEAYVKDDEARNGISTLQGLISALQIADETLINSILDLTDDVDSVVNDMRQIDFSTAVTKGGSGVNSLDDILTYIESDLTIKPTSIKVTSTNGNIIELSESDAKLYNIDSLSKINIAISENEIIDIFFGDGLKDKYILSATPILNDADKPIKVYLDGTPKTSGYDISNNEITFNNIPYPFGRIKVIYSTNDKKYNYSISDAQQSANGVESLAIGKNSISNGNYSIAAGQDTVSSGVGSVALGYNTIASGDFLLVFGRNNEEDTENQYIEIVGNGDYRKFDKEEIFTSLTNDNNIQLTENSIISINNIQTNSNNYNLTSLITETWYSAQSIAAGSNIDRSINIVFYTANQFPTDLIIPIKIDISYKLGSTSKTAFIEANLKDDNIQQSEGNIEHSGLFASETINCDFSKFNGEDNSKAISNITISSVVTNFTNDNNRMLINDHYQWPYNNNILQIKIISNKWINYFNYIPNFDIIINYTYKDSNNIPRSNARTLDWDGNECIAGNLTVGGSLSFKSGIKYYSTDSTHDQLKAKQEFTIFNSTILSSGVYIVKGSMSVSTSTNALGYTLKIFTTNTQETESISISSTKNAQGILKTWFYLPNDDYINLSITPSAANAVTFSNNDNYLQIIKIA